MIVNEQMRTHLREALEKNARFDNRKTDAFRDVSVEYGVVESAEGSAKVILGDTEVIAGVKLALEKPYPDTPEEGMLMVNAELLPLSSPDFESGPPSIESIELARVVDRGIREAEAIDVKKLCITPGEQVWSVSVDIIPINADGNLLDAAGLAVIAALKDTKFPKEKDGVVDYKEKTSKKLPLNKEPIPVTVHCVGEQIYVDPTRAEEPYTEARLTVASIDEKTICAMQKGGDKGLSVEQIDSMVTIALKKGKELRKAL